MQGSNTHHGPDINKILLNLSHKTINSPQLIENIEEISIKLSKLAPNNEKDKHKYLCLSCIFGAFLGDSIGSCCEFSSESSHNHNRIFQKNSGLFRPGEITDDSEMAISAAFAYIDSLNEKYSNIQNLLYYYYGIWRSSGPKDIGNATIQALSYFSIKQKITETVFNNQKVRQYNWDSLANGFLMRISTFITYYYYTHLKNIYDIINNFFNQKTDLTNDLSDSMIQLYCDIYIESYKNVEITHPNYENGISSAVFTLLTLVGMVTKDAKNMIHIFNLISYSNKFVMCHANNNLINVARNTQQKYLQIIKDINNKTKISVHSSMGYYLHGFRLSIYFLYKYPEMGSNKYNDVYYNIMCEICDYGGDTDTNCAIVGAMIGPLIGYKNFKKSLFETFIRFYPEKRCQFSTAFMYLYVNYLEEKIFNVNQNINMNKDNNAYYNIDKSKDKNKAETEGDTNIENKKENNDPNLSSKTPNFISKENDFKYTAFNMILQFLNEKLDI